MRPVVPIDRAALQRLHAQSRDSTILELLPEVPGAFMAKPNYSQQKKQRELAAKKKREEKQQRRQQKKDDAPPPPST